MEQKIVIFDLDGTLALIDHRRHLVTNGNKKWDEFFLACDKDEPNMPLVLLARRLYHSGIKIVIFSGRGEIAREKTIKWLRYHYIPYDSLYMRPPENYTPDEQLKRQWLKDFNRDNILVVFDDRKKVVDMWREEGLTCLQVADGDF